MEQRKLKSFDMAKLAKLREYGGLEERLYEELEVFISGEEYLGANWELLKDEPGEVWRQDIGTITYHREKHIFSYLYVKSTGLAVGLHGHKNVEHPDWETTEYYVFPDGRIEECSVGDEHTLVNIYGRPIYVLSVKKVTW